MNHPCFFGRVMGFGVERSKPIDPVVLHVGSVALDCSHFTRTSVKNVLCCVDVNTR